jgi:hypothetical protein
VIAAVATLNIVLGLVYFQYGTMTAIELRRNWREMGLSRFGIAWILMAFTCGPHHLVHGIHVAMEGRHAGDLDLIATLIAFPPGVIWFLLRLEAFRGGRATASSRARRCGCSPCRRCSPSTSPRSA